MIDWVVERMVPSHVVSGLLTGAYKLYGGVIRWAPGTEHAGEIVRHLVPVGDIPLLNGVFDIVNSVQLWNISEKIGVLTEITSELLQFTSVAHIANLYHLRKLSETTDQILQVATGTMFFSGLNLAVSAIGFSFLSKKLKRIENRLDEIQKEIRDIRDILERSERAELRAAIRDLLKINDTTSPENRHTILHNSRLKLAQINERYRELLAKAETVESAMTYEEYFALTALTQTRCAAELGMHDIAVQEIKDMGIFWQKQARRILTDLLLGERPERFLFSDFSKNIPVSTLTEWLNFAHDDERGYAWIDDLRTKTAPWYCTDWLKMPRFANSKKDLCRENEVIIPSIQRLVSRNNVFEGYITQYELMAKNGRKPLEFENGMRKVAQNSASDGYLILRPTEASAKRSIFSFQEFM